MYKKALEKQYINLNNVLSKTNLQSNLNVLVKCG